MHAGPAWSAQAALAGAPSGQKLGCKLATVGVRVEKETP